MTKRATLTLAAFFLATATLLHAQAPAGSTGQCKDGTYSTAASKDGACRGHKGVQTWYAAGPAKPASTAAATTKPAPTLKPAPPTSVATSSGTAPSGSNGQCKDGTYSTAASKDGACRGHQGVKTWFAASGPTPPRPSAAPSPAPTPAPAPRPAPAAQPASSQPARTQPAPGGGNGQVWVNTETKVYHCSGDRYYGKTKQGSYMSQSDAQAKGFRPDAGKPCTN